MQKRTYKNKKTITKSLYGRICLIKGYCRKCKQESIILDDKFQCCDSPFVGAETIVTKREIAGENQRSQLPPAVKREILELQGYLCAYCKCDLNNTWYMHKRNRKPNKIKVHFDHVIPWSYTRETHHTGIVATCNICNLIKSSKLFDTYEKMAEYIMQKRKDMELTLF